MKTKITFQNRLYQDKKHKNNPGTLFIFVFLTLYFLSQLSAIYLNDVRANIKIKKKRKRKINLLTPWPCWVTELQRWKKGKGRERRKRKGTGRKGKRVGGRKGWGWSRLQVEGRGV